MQPANLTANNRIAIIAIFFCISFLCAELTSAQPGSLDPTFGIGGKVVTDFGGNDRVSVLKIQTDGKFLVAGSVGTTPVLARYKVDGSLDSSFGTNGLAVAPIYAEYAVTLQQDGKIILGDFSSGGHVCRLNSDGTTDSSFGINGIVELVEPLTVNFSVTSVGIKKNGEIVVSGYAWTQHFGGIKYSFFITQLFENGAFDSSFGNNAFVFTEFGTRDDLSYSAIIQDDEKIISAGFRDSVNLGFLFELVRYKTNGLPDSSFGVNAKFITDVLGVFYNGCSLALQPDGKILMSGTFQTIADANFVLFRFKPDGNLDSAFGTNGKVITDFSGFDDNSGTSSLAIDKDGKIIIAGSTNNGSYNNFGLIRYNADGSPDNSFGSSGKVMTDFGNNDAQGESMALQEDGKIVIAGYATNGTDYDFALARYDTSSTLPITLTSFTATKQKASVLLNWQTASEINNAYFSVERSNNGNNFSEIGKVNSKGNSNRLQEYSFTDVQPSNGENYYRLKQVDQDGCYTYSKFISVDFAVTVIYKLYPNPVKNMLHLDGLSAATATTVSLIALDGRVMSKKIISASSYDWNTKSLAAGTYYLRIEENKKITTLKFIKQ